MSSSVTLNVNGVTQTVTVSDSGMPLLWVLRDVLGLTGTKYGCGIEVCGACTVLVNGQAQKSCDMDVGSAVGKTVMTVEGLAADPDGQKAQAAWIANQVPQCGYCQSGMLMATVGAIKAGHHGSSITSEMDNICVCGTYQRINKAVLGL
jgi:isoquinoline 1-oxidoreductase alpha subunit